MAPKRKASAQVTLEQTSEYEMHCKLSRERIDELKNDVGSEASDVQFITAPSLVTAAQDVSN
jgi:hypothetical protein